MKVLFINHFKFPDYLNDMVYHGLIDSGFEVYETAYPTYMLKSHPNPLSLYGKGFSIFCKLDHLPKVESSHIIEDKIKSKFYDLIIFGSIHRDTSYLNIIKQYYNKDNIHFIDGEDGIGYISELCNLGKYWKRECVDSNINPISFAIPESQLVNNNPKKTKLFAHIIPGDMSTYIFNDENSYYADYQTSYYGITHKKAGWDCMRHYEILANKCIPYFHDLAYCPTLTMTNFPKEIILETNEYAKQNKIHPQYEELSSELLEYTRKNLTTKKLVNKIIC